LTRCPKRIRKTRKSLLFDKVEEFKENMEIFLNECDNEPRLVTEEEVIEKTTLVTIVDSANVRVDEKFRVQETIVDYNSDEDYCY
jgi:predicted transcriptional regulator